MSGFRLPVDHGGQVVGQRMWIGMRTSWYEEWKRSKAEDKVKAETIIGTSLIQTRRTIKKVLIIIEIDRI